MKIHPTVEKLLQRRLRHGFHPESKETLKVLQQTQTVEGRQELAATATTILKTHTIKLRQFIKGSTANDVVARCRFTDRLARMVPLLDEGEEIYALALTDRERQDQAFRGLREEIDSLRQGCDVLHERLQQCESLPVFKGKDKIKIDYRTRS